VFENKVLKRTLGHKIEVETGVRENYIMRNFIICALHLIFLG
jgi:hypothetical protein